jgi:hypothetical protein
MVEAGETRDEGKAELCDLYHAGGCAKSFQAGHILFRGSLANSILIGNKMEDGSEP